jgi:hypothetical protein
MFQAFQFEITNYFAGMVELVFPEPDFKIREHNGRPELFDVIRSKWIALGPEEWVRQNFIQWMVKVNQIPLSAIAVEKQLKLGQESRRFDVLVYDGHLQPIGRISFDAVVVLSRCYTSRLFGDHQRYHLSCC